MTGWFSWGVEVVCGVWVEVGGSFWLFLSFVGPVFFIGVLELRLGKLYSGQTVDLAAFACCLAASCPFWYACLPAPCPLPLGFSWIAGNCLFSYHGE